MKHRQETGFGILIGLVILVVVFAIFASLIWYGYKSGRFDGLPFAPTVLHTIGDKNVATLTGTVTAGPTSPVCGSGQLCMRIVTDRVMNAEDMNGTIVATARTDRKGVYTMYLAPGAYVLVPVPAIGLGRGKEVTVKAGVNHFDVMLDTGIR